MMKDLWFARVALAGNKASRNLLMLPPVSADNWLMLGHFLPLHDADFARFCANGLVERADKMACLSRPCNAPKRRH